MRKLNPATAATIEIIERYNEAFNKGRGGFAVLTSSM
jgi:hypothetical protein